MEFHSYKHKRSKNRREKDINAPTLPPLSAMRGGFFDVLYDTLGFIILFETVFFILVYAVLIIAN